MDSGSYEETYKRVEALGVKMENYDLTNISRLYSALKLKQDFFAIHVVGTNGKGSVTAFLSSILAKAGYRTGAFVSPHLFDLRERILLNNKMIPKKDFQRLAQKIFDCMGKNNLEASYFEFTTVLAAMFFTGKKVEIAVLEAGLGGRLDATNFFNGKINVVTSISLEHTATLGGTIEKIALEKAGVIKPGSVTVISKNNAGMKTVKKIAGQKKSMVIEAGFHDTGLARGKQSFELVNPQKKGPFRISLLGHHQAENASLAISAALELKKFGFNITEKAIREGFLSAENNGRLVIVGKNPLMVFDCAHNPGGFEALKKNLGLFKFKRLLLVFSVMKDKEWKKMLESFPFDELLVSGMGIERGLDPAEVKKAFPQARVFDGICSAIKTGKKNAKKEDLVLVAGSIHAIGLALQCIKKH
ncbi:MAG: folylpolyglutamate synthase/dihydrofolate synthase family protein [archaeon]|nr:folylpolyglutamate synthase/dihydrofolate synthase family protein [archaeon]